MTKEMDSVDVILNAFDKTRKLTKGKAFPFMCHCVVSFISAKDAFDYLISNGFKVTHRTVVSWRREASIWLGLAQTGKGRISESDARKMRDDWHAKYGYPTYQDFFQGWKPGEVVPEKSAQEERDSSAKKGAKMDNKSTSSKSRISADNQQNSPSISDEDFRMPEKKMNIKIT